MEGTTNVNHPIRWLKTVGLLLLVGVFGLYVYPPLCAAAIALIAVIVFCIAVQLVWWSALVAVGYEPGASRRQLRKLQQSTAALERAMEQRREQ